MIYFENTIYHLSVKYEIGTTGRSVCGMAVFMKRFYFFLLKTDHFWGFSALFKGKFSETLGQYL